MHIRFNGYEIGCTHDSDVFIAEYQIGETAIDDQDQARMGADGVHVGNDYLRSSQWSFLLTVHDQQDTKGVLETIGGLERVWKAAANRKGTPVRLEYSTDHGQTWHFVRGRPREFLPVSPDFQAKYYGRGRAQITFRQSDVRHYSVYGPSTRISSAPSQGSAGWVAPFVFPLVAGGLGGPELGAVINNGDRPAPLTVTFGGQVTEPRVRNLKTGAVVGVRGSLAWDERVTVDAMNETVELWRTGEPHIKQSVPGRLIRATRMTKMFVPPGESPFEFRSQTASDAFVSLSAPSAYTSLQ